MSGPQVQFIEVGSEADRRRIAYISQAGTPGAPGLLWLAGLKSDMVSTKAEALSHFAAERGLSYLRFDYSGHGQSEGMFENGTVGAWLEEALAAFSQLTIGAQIVVGSSTGGHIALLMLRHLLANDPREAERLRALVLIAPAWDLTEELMWKQFPETARREIMEQGYTWRPSDYGEPYRITRRFIEEGRNHLLARQTFDPGRPIVILQGLQDRDVPAAHVRDLITFVAGGWARIVEVEDGEHRLSRPQDLQLLFSLIDRELARLQQA
jgi:pimeloyl-ACP methyl ester carboxylesterase